MYSGVINIGAIWTGYSFRRTGRGTWVTRAVAGEHEVLGAAPKTLQIPDVALETYT